MKVKKIEWLGKTPTGYELGRYKNEAGGYCYVTTELGTVIYDTSLHNFSDILFAIAKELERQVKEKASNQD